MRANPVFLLLGGTVELAGGDELMAALRVVLDEGVPLVKRGVLYMLPRRLHELVLLSFVFVQQVVQVIESAVNFLGLEVSRTVILSLALLEKGTRLLNFHLLAVFVLKHLVLPHC